MTRKLGEILMATGAITPAVLDEALQSQITTGVRAGTALVQYQTIPLEQVCHSLSIQHSVPCPTPDVLLNIDSDVLGLIPEELCRKHAVLPFRVEGGSVCLAMRDPHRDVAGEISLAVQRPVKRFVVPELRMMYLLERHLHMPRQPRYLREQASGSVTDERRTHVFSTVNTASSERPVGQPDVVTLDGRIVHETEPADGVEAAIRSIRPVDVTLARLPAAQTGEAIIRLLVEPVLDGTAASILFFVKGHHAIACCAHGIETTAERLQRLVVPLDTPSLMQWAGRMYSVLRGIADPVQWEIARYFGLPPPGEVCVAPIVPRNKVVNLLCVWSKRGATLGPDAPHVLGELVQGGAEAYLELARRRKQP